jgi:hypothetical protein
VRPVEFDSGNTDPFRFEWVVDQVAQRYIPFSGIVRKPIYLFFVRYINYLLENGNIEIPVKKEKNSTRARLEKLYLECLRRRNPNGLRGRSIIGNSKRGVNPFEGNDGNWVIQNAFLIYGSSAKTLVPVDIIEKYIERYPEEIEILNRFLRHTGSLERNRHELNQIIDQLADRDVNLFAGNLLLAKRWRKELRGSLRDTLEHSNLDQAEVGKLFDTPAKATKRLLKVLISEKYPFISINRWFACFVAATDSDIQDKHIAKLWKKSDDAYKELKEKVGIKQHPDPRCWFEKENYLPYKKNTDFKDSRWSALVRRANRFQNTKIFYDFRVNALGSLIEELDENAE